VKISNTKFQKSAKDSKHECQNCKKSKYQCQNCKRFKYQIIKLWKIKIPNAKLWKIKIPNVKIIKGPNTRWKNVKDQKPNIKIAKNLNTKYQNYQCKYYQPSTSESIKCTSISLESINNVHGRHRLSPSMLHVCQCIMNHVLQKNLEKVTSFFVDQPTHSLDIINCITILFFTY